MRKIPATILLLRKSGRGEQTPVLKSDDFPLPFVHGGRRYVINRTRAGRLIMTIDE